jgi:hypothetical protein
MPVLLTVHVPNQPVLQRTLGDGDKVVLGRDEGSDLVVAHDSVSRRHACIEQDETDAWTITDLGSKNGVRIDGARQKRARLRAQEWFAVGDVFCRFQWLDAAGSRRLGDESQRKRRDSSAWTERLVDVADAQSVLRTTLAGIVELAECRRGFLFTAGPAGQLDVRVCAALDPHELTRPPFNGSRSAIARAMRDRRAVFLSDRPECAWLHDQVSVVALGIRALVALPLIHDGLLLGVAYADTQEERKVFTDLDAELLDAFAHRAAMALAMTNLEAELQRMESWLSLDGESAPATASALRWNPGAEHGS